MGMPSRFKRKPRKKSSADVAKEDGKPTCASSGPGAPSTVRDLATIQNDISTRKKELERLKEEKVLADLEHEVESMKEKMETHRKQNEMLRQTDQIRAQSRQALIKADVQQEAAEEAMIKENEVTHRTRISELSEMITQKKCDQEEELKKAELEQADLELAANVTIKSNEMSASRNAKIRLSQAHETQQTNIALANVREQSVQQAQKEADVRDAARTLLMKVLNINDDSIRHDQQFGASMNLAKFLFLFVIIGCELDLYGFVLSFITYWQAGVVNGHVLAVGWVMRVMLVIGPTGYFLAVFWYMCTYSRQRTAFEERSDEVQFLNELPKIPQREPVHLRPYHFFPVVRYYLLIKDQEPEDVEGLFRVNGLSTFTIGIAQIFCGSIGLSQGIVNFDIFLKIGVMAQCVNIMVTIIYFATPFANLMKAGVAIEAFIYTSDEDLRAQMIQYDGAVMQWSRHPNDDEAKDIVQSLHDTADLDIREACRLGNVEESLKMFDMAEKTRIRRVLRLRKTNEFAKIGRKEKVNRRKCFPSGCRLRCCSLRCCRRRKLELPVLSP